MACAVPVDECVMSGHPIDPCAQLAPAHARLALQRLYPCDCHAGRAALVSARPQCKWPVVRGERAWRAAADRAKPP